DGIVTIASTHLHALAVDSQGRILVGGERSSGILSKGFVARLEAGGRFDGTFGAAADGTYLFEPLEAEESSQVAALALDAADRVLVAGAYESWGSGMGTDFSIARLD